MFITICNLPLTVKVKDIKKLLEDKCQLEDVILGQLTRDDLTQTKKITLGLADECDAAIVFRKLNGLPFNGQPMVLEDSRKKKGPVPGEIPQVMNTMQYQATAMHMQTQQMMMPGYNAMGMMSAGYYNPVPMQGMMQPAVMEPQGYGYVQQPMMPNQETVRGQHQVRPHPQHQMHQPNPPIANRPQHQLISQNRQEHPQPHQRNYEERRNDYQASRSQEPYREQAVVHKTVLDWDIPSREVVFQETDPVWGVRTKKHSEKPSNNFELDNPSNRNSSAPRPSRWDESQGNANNEHGYGYQTETRSEAYHQNNSGGYENYENPHPSNVEPQYNQEWQPQQNYDNFEMHNRKRSYNETRRNEYQTNVGNTGYQRDNMPKRTKANYYENTYDPNEMAGDIDSDGDNGEIEIPSGAQLSFKKFKFSHKLPIAGFKAFEDYMFKNLISKRFTSTIKAYNTMYTVCRSIMRKVTKYLGINLRKYAYYLLNYIQVTIEKVLGESLYDHRTWKSKTFFEAFDRNYTIPQFFQMFQNWFEQFDKLEFIATPQFNAIMSQPIITQPITQPAMLAVQYKQSELVKIYPKKGGKPIYEGKPGSKLARATAAHNAAFPAVNPERPNVKAIARAQPNVQATAQAKPWVKPNSQSKTWVNPNAQAKTWVKPNAQAKPWVKPNAQPWVKHFAPNAESRKALKENYVEPEIDPEMAPNDAIVQKKIKKILSLPCDLSSTVLRQIRVQLEPDINKALDLEMAGLDAALTAGTHEEVKSVEKLYGPFRGGFKRSLIYRLFTAHIARTAKVTFAPNKKLPSLAACNEFFNDRQGRVLHMEQNVAMVLFSTNDTINKMCAENDVEVDGCKIKEIIPLDLDGQDTFHSAIEDAIKADKSDDILDLIFNKAYFKTNIKDKNFLDDCQEQSISDQSATNNDSNATKLNPKADEAKEISSDSVQSNNKNEPEMSDTPIDESNEQSDIITNTQTEIQSNNQTEIETDSTSTTKAEQTENTEIDEEPNSETETFMPQSPDGDDRDEKIKEFLDDFEKVINEDDEVFMSDDDLEDFDL